MKRTLYWHFTIRPMIRLVSIELIQRQSNSSLDDKVATYTAQTKHNYRYKFYLSCLPNLTVKFWCWFRLLKVEPFHSTALHILQTSSRNFRNRESLRSIERKFNPNFNAISNVRFSYSYRENYAVNISSKVNLLYLFSCVQYIIE